ncbi:hypothetical protein [Chryseobacterium populi]|uniref:hypothetical protein n=1 Tax=Chryseobacterium populi TaxID=1144316 RepID=UPI0002DEF5EC|nr:hypothetical protein [Chryseobacterium populi]
MKKFISLKISLVLIILFYSATLISCRQDDDNDFQRSETVFKENKTTGKTIQDSIQEGDPPIKTGSHWKTKN